MSREVWENIPGFNRIYQASSFGRIRRISFEHIYNNGNRRIEKEYIHKGSIDKDGYSYVCLRKNNKKGSYKVHRLIGYTFLNLEKDKQINHLDGNKSNNHISNLEVCNASQNIQHAFKIGLKTQKGINNNAAVMNWDKVKQVREMWKSGKYTQTQLKNHFEVSRGCILGIIYNLNWKESDNEV